MIEIGGKPILWHIMKSYSAHGINDFVICCGYKGYVIKEYFANYFLHTSDITFDLVNNTTTVNHKYSEPWTITVINDTDFKVRNAFERWSNGINQHEANVGIANPNDYMADMIVEQLDKEGNSVKRYDFRGTFPTNIGAIDLSYENENTIEEFTVELQVNYWESNTTS